MSRDKYDSRYFHEFMKHAISTFNNIMDRNDIDNKTKIILIKRLSDYVQQAIKVEHFNYYDLKHTLSGVKNRSSAWDCVNYIREILDILKSEIPEIIEVSFIEDKLASIEMIIMKSIENMRIKKPKGFILREWHGSTGPYRIDD